MEVPRMFRAQVKEYCNLQFVPDRENREEWLKEWVNPQQTGKPYQHENLSNIKKSGLYGSVYCIPVKFPYRLFTNCGQDTIGRPTLGKNGIPFIPGSSIKGLFRRVCNDEQQKQHYCGGTEKQGILRFHGAYPVGDWTGKHTVPIVQNGQRMRETRYSILDLVHPQQTRQVQNQDGTTAIALISLHQPTLIFQFSSTDSTINWKEVETLLKKALSRGLGGKTSTGYGFPDLKSKFTQLPDFTQSENSLHIPLEGSGVCSVTLTKDPEFRPNIFKASLRSHVTRILAGICSDENRVNQTSEELFGSNTSEGLVKIFWEQLRYNSPKNGERNPTYSVVGKLHITAPENTRELIGNIIKFAYIMAGFGKSWRRVEHRQFYSWYHENKFAIGCHWTCSDENFISIQNQEDLSIFLDGLYNFIQKHWQIDSPRPINCWRESWHPYRVVVYSQIVHESQAIRLFHDENFKTTPAIGGRKLGDERPTFVSCVWHRMLPITGNQYLEIVTLFHGGNSANSPGLEEWRRQGTNQLPLFVQRLKQSGFILTWGDEPPI
ncbi:MAG: hypothetical protein F6J89_02590 [Symploca sp. SIO1C4]|uniref:CRISPR type III-associated protein domain-containing protein n=1 Tax=Symploca sp. SIO1C4 TaxID=2607765 RepID=A0A6B3N0B6_9CYAN|nr:hypothetical protein [Symploca sp. SIO1C4]